MDLDYKDDEEMSFEQIKSVCKVICDKVSKFGGKDALISVAEPKPVDTLIKTGYTYKLARFCCKQVICIGY
jgi:hypothetical protein